MSTRRSPGQNVRTDITPASPPISEDVCGFAQFNLTSTTARWKLSTAQGLQGQRLPKPGLTGWAHRVDEFGEGKLATLFSARSIADCAS
jgi:hypothetical protein